VFAGLFLSYEFDIIAGGAIVLLALVIFVVMLVVGNFKKVR
jgi:ABC-type Mn2+/Zn2+ transport system permease subunit